ncbi:MAG: MarR family transcriptional regulator [Actinobacteria bacterium]|jgi:DNA-binding MarR family transcriptional regulator|nr:MarR family transcriptional regulator [Actinomycetota bacterium]NBO34433.1 MarR family transcriptional regulator [Actinomycetota bacterium]
MSASDEVDRIVDAWQQERPDLDVAPLQVLSRVSRLARYLDIARREAFAATDLEPGEFDVLAALRRAGKPYALTPSALISQNLVTSGTMTNRIDRLETKNLVARMPDPKDGRGVLVQLTQSGKSAVDRALDELLAREKSLLATVSKVDREKLANVLRDIVLPFDEESAGIEG